jgi:hypothetical protein
MVKRRADSTLDKSAYPNGKGFGVYVVWQCFILGNMKLMLSTDLPDGKYYEVTYNYEKGEFYLDEYVRVHNECDTMD